jgi:hypothetical protein
MAYENISKWTRPQHYMGATWENWYSSGVGQSRDSDALERANFGNYIHVYIRLLYTNLASGLVIDEDLWSEYEVEDCRQTWENCYSESERADYLRKHVSKVYPFPGETAYRMLRRAVKGDWSYAANLLPCPSDLIA